MELKEWKKRYNPRHMHINHGDYCWFYLNKLAFVGDVEQDEISFDEYTELVWHHAQGELEAEVKRLTIADKARQMQVLLLDIIREENADLIKAKLAASEAAKAGVEKKYERALKRITEDGCYCPIEFIESCDDCEYWDANLTDDNPEEGVRGCNFDSYFSSDANFKEEGEK